MPIRATGSHKSEMISQLIFGETFQILESRDTWHFIKTDYDSYSGWVSIRKPVEFLTENEPVSFLYEGYIFNDHDEILLSYGSVLYGYNEEERTLLVGEELFELEGEVIRKGELEIPEIAEGYLNTPYLWGGRSEWGIDCSGFTQQVFRMASIYLPRDSGQQVKEGIEIATLGEALAGDLIFFAEDGTHVSHVGIYLGDNEIIHASFSVRIDDIDEKGIFNREINSYTMKAHAIRRIQ